MDIPCHTHGCVEQEELDLLCLDMENEVLFYFFPLSVKLNLVLRLIQEHPMVGGRGRAELHPHPCTKDPISLRPKAVGWILACLWQLEGAAS